MNKHRTSVALSLAAVAGLAGLVAVPQIRTADAAILQEAKSYAVDPVHSTIVFSALYAQQSPFYGMFTQTGGTMSYDGSNASSLTVDIVAPLESIDTHNEQRDAHLKSPDWFNAAEHPNVRFTGSNVSTDDDGKMTMEGELTLNGQTKPAIITVTHLKAGTARGQERMGLGATFTIKRSEFGVTSSMGPNGIGDEITLHVGLQGVAQ
jgi:polyisoprenoid-binding protein YceI